MPAFLLAFSVTAEESQYFVCSHDSKTSTTIGLVYTNPPSKLPCKVTYAHGEKTDTLWQATTIQNYCQAKTTNFIAQKKRLGYRCKPTAAPTSN